MFSPSVKDQFLELLPEPDHHRLDRVDRVGLQRASPRGQGREERAPAARPCTAGADVVVLDEDLKLIPDGDERIGKLGRGGNIPLGYFNDPEKTAETFVIAADGQRYAVSGDSAQWAGDGPITLLGRGSVSINSGGEKIYPEEVEQALKDHPAVFDCIVVGVPDERWGQRVAAVVQFRDGQHGRARGAGRPRPQARRRLQGPPRAARRRRDRALAVGQARLPVGQAARRVRRGADRGLTAVALRPRHLGPAFRPSNSRHPHSRNAHEPPGYTTVPRTTDPTPGCSERTRYPANPQTPPPAFSERSRTTGVHHGAENPNRPHPPHSRNAHEPPGYATVPRTRPDLSSAQQEVTGEQDHQDGGAEPDLGGGTIAER